MERTNRGIDCDPSSMNPRGLSLFSDDIAGSRGLSEPRMSIADIGNLLDSDGNLQNELLVFAFAATLLATIPILLGNEFDVNIGLRRRRRRAAMPLLLT